MKNEGHLENLDNPGQKISSFTQQSINNMKIIYHPPPFGGASEEHFNFTFIGL